MTRSLAHELDRDSPIEVLLSWGATLDPALCELLAVVDAARTARHSSPRGILVRALSDVPSLIGPEWARKIEQALAAPSGAADLAELAEQVGAELVPLIESRLALVTAEAALWSRHGEGSAVSALWPTVGRIERAENLEELIEADKELGDLERMLAERRRTVTAEIARLGGGAGAATDRDLAIVLPELRELRRAASAGDVARKTSELSESWATLTTLLEKLNATSSKPDGLLASAMSQVLRSAAESSVAAGQRLLDAPADLDSRLSLVRSWTGAVRTFLEESSAGNSSPKVWTELVECVKAEIGVVVASAQTLPDSVRPPGLDQMTQVEEDLVMAATQGGETFRATLTRTFQALHEVRAAVESAASASASRLQESATRLGAFLERVASKLPTARIVAARLHVEHMGTVIAEHDVAAMERLDQVVQRELETLKHDLALIEKHRRDRDEARRDSQREQIRRLEPAAKGRTASALAAISTKLASAQGEEIDALRGELGTLRRGIEREVRVGGWRRVERARKAARRDPRLKASIAGLESDLAGDDLQAIAASSRTLAETLRAAQAPRRRRLWVAAGLVAVALGGAVAWFRMGQSDSTRYEFVLTGRDGPVTLAFVRDGKVVQKADGAAGAELAVDLSPGRYEIFADRTYTGRILQVPEDATRYELTVPQSEPRSVEE